MRFEILMSSTSTCVRLHQNLGKLDGRCPSVCSEGVVAEIEGLLKPRGNPQHGIMSVHDHHLGRYWRRLKTSQILSLGLYQYCLIVVFMAVVGVVT